MPPRSGPIVMTFPPFAGFIRRLVLANVIVFFALALLGIAGHNVQGWLIAHLALTPYSVLHWQVWQIVTYSFVHLGLLDILFNMLALWFIGSYLEGTFGAHWTAELYFISVIGAAFTAIAMAYTGILHLTPQLTIFSATAGVNGLFIGFAVLFGDQEIMLFPLPMRIRAKYLAAIYILISLYFMIRGDLANIAYLGGMLASFLFVKFAPRRGFFGGTSEWYFGLRNAYYRSKRRRAAKKFEVYMGKQGRDVRFDKDGKYIDPDKDSNKWVN